MKRKLAILCMAVALLSTSVAQAEWIIWWRKTLSGSTTAIRQKSGSTFPLILDSKWEIIKSYNSQEECSSWAHAMALVSAELYRKDHPESTITTSTTSYHACRGSNCNFEGSASLECTCLGKQFKCLPATIDPNK